MMTTRRATTSLAVLQVTALAGGHRALASRLPLGLGAGLAARHPLAALHAAPPPIVARAAAGGAARGARRRQGARACASDARAGGTPAERIDMDAIRALEHGEDLEQARLDLSRALADARALLMGGGGAGGGGDAAVQAAAEEVRRLSVVLAFAHVRLGDVLEAEPLLDAVLDETDGDGDGAAGSHADPEGAGGAAAAAGAEDAATRAADAHFLRGVVYQRSDREQEAVDEFEAVLALDETHWRARFHLALLALQWGMHEDARELLAQVRVTGV